MKVVKFRGFSIKVIIAAPQHPPMITSLFGLLERGRLRLHELDVVPYTRVVADQPFHKKLNVMLEFPARVSLFLKFISPLYSEMPRI